mgnify:CR=1 FL=1
MFDATFWVAISFLLFVILLLYKKVPKLILGQIDSKISELKKRIDEAESLKSDSEKFLSVAQGKLSNSEKENDEILKKARKISEDEIAVSLRKMDHSLKNKETAAYNKIQQAKNDAINQVKKEATKIAVQTVEKLLIEDLNIEQQKEINLLKLKDSIKAFENSN